MRVEENRGNFFFVWKTVLCVECNYEGKNMAENGWFGLEVCNEFIFRLLSSFLLQRNMFDEPVRG